MKTHELKHKKNIAIIGSGISGLGCAWMLDNDFDISIYEKNNSLGGHAKTVHIKHLKKDYPVDMGAYLFSPHYTYFTALLEILKISKVDNEFSIIMNNMYAMSTFYYPLKIKYYQLFFNLNYLFNVLRFRKLVKNVKEISDNITLEQYLQMKTNCYVTDDFKKEFMYPLLASIWTIPFDGIGKLPAKDILQTVTYFPSYKIIPEKYYTIKNGCESYINKLVSSLKNTKIFRNTKISSLTKTKKGWTIITEKNKKINYDHVIVATNAKHALAMVNKLKKSDYIKSIMQQFHYHETYSVIHHDLTFMPRDKKHFADYYEIYLPFHGKTIGTVWNGKNLDLSLFTTNRAHKNMFNHDLVYYDETFEHVAYSTSAMIGRKKLAELQGKDNLWFCGVYTVGPPLHESGILSSINIVKKLNPTSRSLASLNRQIKLSKKQKRFHLFIEKILDFIVDKIVTPIVFALKKH